MNIDLGKLSKETGKSEAELAKTIITLLAYKAMIFRKPQKIVLAMKAEEGAKDVDSL